MTNQSLHLFLDTRDRVSGTSTSASFNLSNSNLTGGIYGLSLESVIIPNLEYNINETNNKIYFIENGGPTITTTIPVANYTATELGSEIQLKMREVGSLSYDVAYLTKNGKYEIIAPLPNSFRFVEGTNSINSVIGILPSLVELAAIESTFPVRLDGTEYVDLEISGLNQNYNISSRDDPYIVARIPILEQFGGVIYYLNPDNHNFILVNNDLFYRFKMRLIKPDGSNYTLPENANISYVLRCEKQ